MTDGSPGTSAERLQIPDVQKRTRNQRLVWAVVLIAAALGSLYVYRERSHAVGEAYRTVRVTRRDVVRVIEATGHLDARARYEVPPPFAGRLAEILVRAGDKVKQGQPLARLDDRAGVFIVRNADASMQAATWQMAGARTAFDAAKDDQTRIERLVARGLASEQDVANAKSALSKASAALEAARAEQSVAQGQFASAKFEHTQGQILAPADGVVLTAPENLGSAVTPERALFVIGDPLELMRVDVDVGEADIGDVRPGQPTTFQVQTFPGRTFSARVERVGVEPNREGSVVTYPVRLLADNRDGVLLPGMTAAVQLEAARVSNVLAVREAALRFVPPGAPSAPARTRLFRRVSPAQLMAVTVTAGLSDGTYTEVRASGSSTLSAGDEIAVGLLRPGAADRAQPGISLGSK
ncbi:MAG TPA: efflux RND transporter periplasmic adaptor subunit [Polyangiales bacterium]|nr:efflux RND transporter periplasmic adaptor subunit [Polyangiales bacterium]